VSSRHVHVEKYYVEVIPPDLLQCMLAIFRFCDIESHGAECTFGFLKKDPIGDELTFAYTYENAGSHGFFHTPYGSHTEAIGVMKNFAVPKAKRLTGYTWIQVGITSMTGNAFVQNRFYNGESLGGIIHFNDHHSIWIQEMYNKVVTVPWYTTTSVGYTHSW
jgi:hypothetical protein